MTNRDFIEVTNYTVQVRTQLAQVNYGAQDLFYKQDSSGRLTGDFTDEKEISFENTENYIDTNFKPEIDEYTIYETVTGDLTVLSDSGVSTGETSHRSEFRVFKKEFGDDFFSLTFRTTTVDEDIFLPLKSGYSYDFVIDWGDGSSSIVTAWNDVNKTHSYAIAGDYDVSIKGTMTYLDFLADNDNSAKVVKITNFGATGLVSVYSMCRNLINLEEFSVGVFHNSDMTNASSMFYGHSEQIHLGMKNLVSRSVTSMSSMFYYAQATIIDVSGFDTSNVTSMSSMFRGAQTTIIDVSGWDTANVTNMGAMFYTSQATTLDMSGFDTANVTSMASMFSYTKATIIDVSGWDTANVTSMGSMFYNAQAAPIGVENFNIGLVTVATSFLLGVTLPTAQYDELLINWNAQSHQDNVTFHGGYSKYTTGGAAEAARDGLIADGWLISDGGTA